MDIFKYKDYRDVINEVLLEGKTKRPKGVIQRLAKVLRCHPTLISQVLREKSEFTVDQGVLFCEFARFNKAEMEYFLDLLLFQRAATQKAKGFFSKRLEDKVAERKSIESRLQTQQSLQEEHKRFYYSSWMPPSIHICCQLPSGQSLRTIAKGFGISEQDAKYFLSNLTDAGILSREGELYKSMLDHVHIPSSESISSVAHSTWRVKTLAKLQGQRKDEDLHFSSVFAASTEALDKIRVMILDQIQELQKESRSEENHEVYLFTTDFYKIFDKDAANNY